MGRFGLCESATYSSKSPNFAADRAINLFPERIESGTGKNNFGLLGSPGTEVYALFTDGPSRAEITIPFSYPTAERMFTVQGSTLFEVFGDGDEELGIPNTEPIARGNVGTDGFPAFMAFNGTHLAIASAQKLYLLKLSDNSFTGPIQDDNMDDLAPISVVFLNQYLLINVVATQIVMYSEPGDAETWPVLNFFSAEVDPDRCLMLLVDHVTLWCFGDSSIQPFQNTGDADNPFQAYLAAALQQGLGAPASVVPLDNGIFFLGKDPLRGGIIGWRLDGSSLRRVSNHSVEQFWESYSRTDDAIAYPMVMQGHAWWRITFQEANKTWCYDCSTNMWHELSCWNTNTAEFEAHHIITHTSAFGKHLGGSRMGDCCHREGPEPPPECTESRTVAIPLLLSAGQDFGNDSVDVAYTSLAVRIDTADYPGMVSALWEYTVETSLSLVSQTISLVDETGTVYATETVPAGEPYITWHSMAFTPAEGEHFYSFKMATLNGGATGMVMHRSLIWINTTLTERVKIQIPLWVFDRASYSSRLLGSEVADNAVAYNAAFTSSSYGVGTTTPVIWLKEASKFATVESWELEVLGQVTGADSNRGYASLFNLTTGNQVAASEVEISGSTPARFVMEFPDDASDFDDGDEFGPKFKFVGSGGEFRINRVSLWVTISCLSKCQIYVPSSNRCVANIGLDFYDLGGRTQVIAPNFHSGTAFYFEATAIGGGATSVADYLNAGAAINGTTGSIVSGSTLDFSAAVTVDRIRSGAITLSGTNKYMLHYKALIPTLSFLIAEIT